MTDRPFALRAKGDSMLPLVPDGTLLMVDPRREIRVLDVVVATLPNGTQVAHRVMRLEGGDVYLKGDFNRRNDPVCTRDNIKGTVVSMIRKGQALSSDSLWFRMLTRLTLFTMRGIR